MAVVTHDGEEIRIAGELPAVGSIAPDFSLTNDELADVSLADFAGRRKILNIVPSLDTPVCAQSAREFSKRADALDGVVMLNISMDLPFAAWRLCQSIGLKDVLPLSAFRAPRFAADYGVAIADGKLRGLLARAVLVLDTNNAVLHAQLVDEIKKEPDYEAAIAAARRQ
jgi:thiol peroxidase